MPVLPDSFAHRTRLIGLILLAVMLLAGLRLSYLQLLRHNFYKLAASDEQRRKYEIPTNRGQIFLSDRGQPHPVVLNRTLKTLYADPRYIADKVATAHKLAEITGDKASDYEKALEGNSFYVVLKRSLAPRLAKQIDKLELAGIGLNDTPVRGYPEGSLAAQLLGFVNDEGKGQYGIEEYLNKELAGSTGLLSARTDTRGIPIATSDNVQLRPVDGSDAVLTIERAIQAKVEEVIKDGYFKYRAKAASAVVMDPSNGKILAMANFPTYNPTNYAKVTNYSVFANRAASELYEPGSIFKPFAMGTGLDNAAVTPTTSFFNSGSVRIGGYIIKNAQGTPTGRYSMSDVLTKSVNTGMVEVLRALGGGAINPAAKTKLHDYYAGRFKFGKPSGVEVPSEPGGTLNPPSSDDTNYANMTFGQGLSTTMLQITAGYAAIANGGTLYKPYLVDHLLRPDGSVVATKPEVRATAVLSAKTINQLKRMLERVVEEAGGFGTKISGYRIGGKTGTAQIPNPAGGYFTNRDIGGFAGFAPLNNPRYVMLVRVDEPANTITGFAGSGAAGPMFGEIMRFLLNYGGVAPSG